MEWPGSAILGVLFTGTLVLFCRDLEPLMERGIHTYRAPVLYAGRHGHSRLHADNGALISSTFS